MDVYSLGLVLSHLLSPAVEPPFHDDAAAVDAARRSAAPPPAVLACTASAYANDAIAQLVVVDPVGRPALAAFLESNKYLDVGNMSSSSHTADAIAYVGAGVCVCVCVCVWLGGGVLECTRHCPTNLMGLGGTCRTRVGRAEAASNRAADAAEAVLDKSASYEGPRCISPPLLCALTTYR